MKPHTKIYFKHFKIAFNESGEHDFIPCERCGAEAVDIHHVHGRGKDMDKIDNLMALCRECHAKAHNGGMTSSELNYYHQRKLNK